MGGSPDQLSKIFEMLSAVNDKIDRLQKDAEEREKKLQSEIEDTFGLLLYLNEKFTNINTRFSYVEKKLGINVEENKDL